MLLGLLLVATGCREPRTGGDGTAGIQEALDRRAAAVLAREVPPQDPAVREFAHLARVPLASWTYRVLDVRREGATARVRAEVGHRLDGYDAAAVTGERLLELVERDGRWRVTADRPGGGAAAQLWQQGPVDVVRGTHSLVLGVGQEPARLREIAGLADRAVPAVADAWPGRWARRVVVLVPRSLDDMAALLGEPAARYRGMAAVTTGRTGRGARTPADRVVVNPEAFGALGGFGRRVVLTHETAHAATRADTSAATPMWLSEGFADWVAYRGTGLPAGEIAPELRRAVLAGGPPAALPADGDFAFGGDPAAAARAYEGAWLACRLMAERWGEGKAVAFYRAVGGGTPVPRAMAEVLGTSPDAFTRAWRDFARQELSSAPSR
ncbi:hypothetical protein GCM10023237_49990 [Streptomyces coeruleoprunus]